MREAGGVADTSTTDLEPRNVPKVLILYYSSFGHIQQMADAMAEGVRAAGADVDIRRVPDTGGHGIATSAGFTMDCVHPEIVDVQELTRYDAIIVGAPTRFGRMPSQMAMFWDRTGKLWQEGALNGKVGGAFTSSGSQHGGQETTLFSIITNLLHLGLTIVGLDYGFAGQIGVDKVRGGSPYGATTIAGADGSRRPTTEELDGARYQGRRIAEIAAKLSPGAATATSDPFVA